MGSPDRSTSNGPSSLISIAEPTFCLDDLRRQRGVEGDFRHRGERTRDQARRLGLLRLGLELFLAQPRNITGCLDRAS